MIANCKSEFPHLLIETNNLFKMRLNQTRFATLKKDAESAGKVSKGDLPFLQ